MVKTDNEKMRVSAAALAALSMACSLCVLSLDILDRVKGVERVSRPREFLRLGVAVSWFCRRMLAASFQDQLDDEEHEQ